MTAPGRPGSTSPVPLAVLTGFLGAGKTTILNALLRQPAFAGTAVVVNEFGEVGIDHLLVEAVRDDMLVLTTGCLCCAARGDVVDALDDLLARRARGEICFDRLLIETTGLADPGPILNAVLLAPGLAGATRLARVLTAVAATDGEATLERHEEARRQVAFADRLVVTKADLLEAPARRTALPRLEERLSALNPFARVEEARGVLASGCDPFEVEAPASPRQGGDALHHHAAGARIRAVCVEAGTVETARLDGFISTLQARLGPRLLRLKGIAAVSDGDERPAVIQAVGHILHPATRLSGWPEGERRTRMVAILDGVDPAEVVLLWDAIFGPPGIDTADAAAILGTEGAGLFG